MVWFIPVFGPIKIANNEGIQRDDPPHDIDEAGVVQMHDYLFGDTNEADATQSHYYKLALNNYLDECWCLLACASLHFISQIIKFEDVGENKQLE